MTWNPLEHSIYHQLLKLNLSQKKLVVGLSGGLDSVALLALLVELKIALKIEIYPVHVHHGGDSEYRQKAALFCQEYCDVKGLSFILKKAPDGSHFKSEEELREFRYQVLLEAKTELQADYIVTAHHQDDLLETRLLRLIRGTGLRGLKAMKVLEADLLRPLLQVGRSQLQEYCEQKNLVWIEDPSNQDLGPMRNWLRNQWLPELEAKAPGALASFGRSLELILEQAVIENLPESLWSDSVSEDQHRGISRPVFLTMTEKQQKAVIAQYLLFLGQEEFTQNHILEVIKQLDKSQNEHIFTVAHCEWRISAKQILAYPLKGGQ